MNRPRFYWVTSVTVKILTFVRIKTMSVFVILCGSTVVGVFKNAERVNRIVRFTDHDVCCVIEDGPITVFGDDGKEYTISFSKVER